MQAWQSEGAGCDSLRKGRRTLPSLRTLAHGFCERHAGQTVLFVGDSVQGQLASSFAMALGAYASEPQLPARGTLHSHLPRCKKDRKYLAALATMHEFNLNLLACGEGAQAVRVRFIRNEAVLLVSSHDDGAREQQQQRLGRNTAINTHAGGGGGGGAAVASDDAGSAGRPASTARAQAEAPPPAPLAPPAPPLPRPYLMCEWAEAAAEADLVVLNRGMHYVPDALVAQQLHTTFTRLAALRAPRRGGSPRSAKTADADAADGAASSRASSSTVAAAPLADVVYRSTHASMPSCHLLDDPLPVPFPYAADDEATRSYYWQDFARQNAVARTVADAHSVTFLQVHQQTAKRPGGHMPARRGAKGDCAHYCLPGPIDEWVRLLLALWT